MKTSTILLGLLLAAGAFAALPNAQAMQAPPIIVCVTEPCPGPISLPDACDLRRTAAALLGPAAATAVEAVVGRLHAPGEGST